MVQSHAKTVPDYLEALPVAQRAEVSLVRDAIRKHLPIGFQEVMDFGMIAYVVPLSVLPDTYNGHPLPLAGLAAQKNYNSVYLMSVYGDPATEKWFHAEYKKTGKKLDMGKSCLRFRKADDLPLELIGKTIARVPVDAYVKRYRATQRRRTS